MLVRRFHVKDYAVEMAVSEINLPNDLFDDWCLLAVTERTVPFRFLNPGHMVTGDSLEQANFGPDFGTQVAAFYANRFTVNMQNDAFGRIEFHTFNPRIRDAPMSIRLTQIIQCSK
jgi:hypothetical protein